MNANTDIWQIIVAVLDDTSTDAQKADLEVWLNENEANRKTYDTFFKLHHAGNSEVVDQSKNLIFEKLKEKIENARLRYRLIVWRYVAAAAAVLLLVLGSVVLLNGKKTDSAIAMVDTRNPFGVRSTILLSDGTKVFLNAGSTLSYPAIFKGDQRKVKLEGEAYFEVVKDARHPFVVNADSVDIKVLGTHFNVSAYAEESQVTTTLIEGSVSISKINTEGEMILKPDQQAVYDKKAGNVQLKQVDSKAFAAWREGQYLFEHENFGNIVKKLERGFNVKIAIKSESLKNEVFSGQFDHVESVGQLLNMMKQHRNFDYKIYGNQIDIFQYITLQKTNN